MLNVRCPLETHHPAFYCTSLTNVATWFAAQSWFLLFMQNMFRVAVMEVEPSNRAQTSTEGLVSSRGSPLRDCEGSDCCVCASAPNSGDGKRKKKKKIGVLYFFSSLFIVSTRYAEDRNNCIFGKASAWCGCNPTPLNSGRGTATERVCVCCVCRGGVSIDASPCPLVIY